MKTYEILYPDLELITLRDPNTISIVHGEKLDLSTTPWIDEVVEMEWERRMAIAEKKGQILFPGPQLRLSGYHVEGKQLILELAPSDYKEFVGTNGLAFTKPNLFQKIRQEGEAKGDQLQKFAGIMAECALILTADNYVILTWRSNKVAEYGETWHTVGGHPNAKNYLDQTKSGETILVPEKVDLTADIASEIELEVGLTREEYNLSFMGLVRNLQTLKPEVVFYAHAPNVTLSDMIRRGRHERFEHIEFIGLQPEDIQATIDRDGPSAFCPPGLAAYEMFLNL